MSSLGARGASDGVRTGEGGTSSDQAPDPTGTPPGDSVSTPGREVTAPVVAARSSAAVARGVAAVPGTTEHRPPSGGSGRSDPGLPLARGGHHGDEPRPAQTGASGTEPKRAQTGASGVEPEPAEIGGVEQNAAGSAGRSRDRSADKPRDQAGPAPAGQADAGQADAGSAAGASRAESADGPSDAVDPSSGAGPTDDADDDADQAGGGQSRRAGRLPGRDPLWARALVAFGTVLFLLAGGSITAQKVLANRYDRAVHRDVLLAPGARAGGNGHSALTGPLNFLLIGSDVRDDNPEAGQRSDTAIIVHIPATLDRAYLISIPRDLRVDIPPDPSIGYTGAHSVKINGAFQAGGGGRAGVQLLSATLKQLTGVSFDGAAVIDFSGFRKVVALLGGVDMCVDERTESHHIGFDKNGQVLAPWTGPEGSIRVHESTPYVHEVGCRHMEPWQVLDYVRQRKSIPDGDYGRQRHQQQFLRAVLQEAIRQGVARNPIKADAFIRAIGDSLTVDTNGVALDEFVFGLRNVDPSSLVGVRLPSYPQDINGYSYVLADEALAASLYTAIRDDTLDNWVTANASWVNPL